MNTFFVYNAYFDVSNTEAKLDHIEEVKGSVSNGAMIEETSSLTLADPIWKPSTKPYKMLRFSLSTNEPETNANIEYLGRKAIAELDGSYEV